MQNKSGRYHRKVVSMGLVNASLKVWLSHKISQLYLKESASVTYTILVVSKCSFKPMALPKSKY